MSKPPTSRRQWANRRPVTSASPKPVHPLGVMRRLGTTLRRDENGVALVMVLGVGAVLALLTVAAIAIGIGSARTARIDQDWNGALSAAYAGVEEYQSRLAADPTYGRFGNPAAPYSASSATAISLPTGAAANPAFGLGASGSWATVPGSAGSASYRYEVDVTDFDTTGGISLRSTGRVGSQTRTVIAEVKVNSFLDYLYFTDYEVQDPTGASNEGDCTRYAYAGRRASDGCGELAFLATDVLKGPVHSNDTIRSCGATFTGAVTTAYSAPAGSPLYAPMNSSGQTCAASTFTPATGPTTVGPVVMPATNAALKLETRSDLTTPAGCLFTGPTQITLNSDGTITVRSPWTRATHITGDPASGGTAPAVCGVVGAAGLGSRDGSTFTPPANNVIYVQDVPAVTSDPNYWAASSFPTVQAVTGTGTAQLTCTGAGGQNNGNGIGYPTTGESAGSSDYGCRVGDAFVRGALRGALTIATSRYLYITGNITLASTSRDILGLVGNDAVLLWNPVSSSGSSVLPTAARGSRTIYAAILSVSHTFQLQNRGRGGDHGTLTVVGAIAQKFRGLIYSRTASGVHGYIKDYSYDNRFTDRTPPKFLLPVSTSYGVTLWIETAAAFDASGAAR